MNKEQLQERVKDIENGFLPYQMDETGHAKIVQEAMNYSIQVGGKRLRPMFMQATYYMFGGTNEGLIRPFMMAIEMIHTYSLVHDDLPALDNDDYRRGQLTTHKKYGEDMGILTGDALLNRAYETAFLAFEESGAAEVVGQALRILGEKAGISGMVGGQVADVYNNGRFMNEEQLLYVHKNKTAALIEASLMIGAALAGATKQELLDMEKVGTCVGLAFQIQDDILDVIGKEELIGKPVHSDEKNEKTTFVSVYGINESQNKVKSYTNDALAILDNVKAIKNEEKEFLIELFQSLVGRES